MHSLNIGKMTKKVANCIDNDSRIMNIGFSKIFGKYKCLENELKVFDASAVYMCLLNPGEMTKKR